VIQPQEISTDEDLARRILVRARFLAPGIDAIPHGDERRLDALAILKGVIAEVPAPGSRRVKGRGRNGTSVSYFDVTDAFSEVDISNLRSLVSAAPSEGLAIGSFPDARPIDRQWPEGGYS
jgi:hypothetical protein